MSQSITLIKRDGKINFLKQSEKKMYDALIANMKEGDMMQMYVEVTDGIGQLSQLAKLHAGFKKVADQIGESSDKVKLDIKHAAGFCITGECRSMGEMSHADLETMWQVLVSKGEFVGINLR